MFCLIQSRLDTLRRIGFVSFHGVISDRPSHFAGHYLTCASLQGNRQEEGATHPCRLVHNHNTQLLSLHHTVPHNHKTLRLATVQALAVCLVAGPMWFNQTHTHLSPRTRRTAVNGHTASYWMPQLYVEPTQVLGFKNNLSIQNSVIISHGTQTLRFMQ